MSKWAFILALFVSLGLSGPAPAGEPKISLQLVKLEIPKGKGDRCVEDTDFMRRNHMHLLDHQRDDTVHEGVRTKRHSLKGCIDCHAVNGSDGKPVTVKDPKHFCRGCHDYVAVKVDCFQCHASRPDPAETAGLNPNHEMAALQSYLQQVKP